MIEPHNASTISIRAILPDRARTLADYQANVRKRFGGNMPSWPELAKRENRAMWIRLGKVHAAEPNAAPAVRAEKGGDRYETMRATWQAKVADTKAQFLRILTKPMTSGDVSRALGINNRTAHERLSEMAEEGLIIRRLIKSVAIWEPRQEAAE